MSALAASPLQAAQVARSQRLPAGQQAFVAAPRSCSRPRAARAAAQAAAAAGSDGGGADPCAAAAAQQRRRVLLGAGTLAAAPLLQLGAGVAAAAAEEGGSSGSRRAYFDVTVDRKPLGRFVIEVPTSAPKIGGQRFLDLAQGKEGVAFRKTKIELIEDGFIQDSGLKVLSRVASGRTAITGGADTELLEEELAAQSAAAVAAGTSAHGVSGLVSILVLPRIEIVNKDKLVASKGKLITVTETFGEIPNGSAFAVTTSPTPELDATHLVVGRVVEGLDVIKAIEALPRVKDNTSSPYFQAGKALGDKRADVAQRAFNKPFNKIRIEECGLL